MKIKNKIKVKQRNVNQLMALLVTVAVLFITVASPISFALENPKSRQPQIIGIEELREGDEVVLVEKNSDSTKTEALTQNNAVETIDLKNIDEKFKFSFMKKNEDGTMVFSPGERLLSGEEIEKYDVYLVFRDTKEKQEAVEEKDKTEQKNADEEVMQEITENTEKETDSLAAADEEQTEEMFNLHVEEKWDDNNNAAGKRPQEIEVRLFANDTFADKKLKLSEENAWKGSFKNLPVEKDGEKISYTVTAEVPEGYESQTVYSEKNYESEDVHVRAASVDEKKKDVNDSNAVITCTYKGKNEVKKELEPQLTCTKQIDAFSDNDDNPDTKLDDEADDKEDLYRLYLTTKAEYKETPIDFLFIIDRSGSMAKKDVKLNSGEYRRDEAISKILNGKNGIIAKALKMNPQNAVAAVGFYGKDSLGKDLDTNIISPWTQQSSEWVTRSEKDFTSGTNYAAGFYRANNLLAQRRGNGHKKVVIFLSDGVPTYYLEGYAKKDSSLERFGTEKYGRQASSNVKNCIKPSEKVFDWFLRENPGIEVHSIGVSKDLNDGHHSSRPDVLKYYAEKGKGKFVHASKGEEIIKAFTDAIDSQTYKNVEINDTLSEYVDLHETSPDIKIASVEKNAKEEKVLWEDGKVTDAGKNIIKLVKADEDGKITAEFWPEYKLSNGTDYVLSYNVQTTSKAAEEYLENGYKHKGDPGTDFGENKTSSGQPGFYSSDVAEASYIHGGKNDKKPYSKPVVQSRANKDFTVEKIWDDRYKEHNPVKVTLYQDGKVFKKATLSKDSEWKYVWNNLPLISAEGVKHNYIVREDSIPENYTVVTSGGANCPEIQLKYGNSEIVTEPVSDFTDEGKYVITGMIKGVRKALAFDGEDLEWVPYKRTPSDDMCWDYNRYRYLKKNGYYLGYDEGKIEVIGKKPKRGRFGIENGHLFVLGKHSKDNYYLHKNGWNLYKKKKINSSEMLKVQLYKESASNIKTVKGNEAYFYIVNKKGEEPEFEVEEPHIVKQIDSLVNNIEGTDSYNFGSDDSNVQMGTKISGRNDYRLKLTLDGSKDDRGVDVLFVVDNTSSMTSKLNKKSKIKIADEIINGTSKNSYKDGMLNKILALNPKNKVAVTTFVGGDRGEYFETSKDDYNPILVEWTGNDETLKPYPARKIETNEMRGTNYMGAMLRAEEMIDDISIRDDGNFKAVIFVTDGEPNHYMKEAYGKHEYYDDNNLGSGELEELCVNAIRDFHLVNEYVSFDTIGIGKPENFEILRKMAAEAGGKCYTAQTEGKLIDSVNNVVSRYFPDSVEIIDPLSQYVDLNTVPDLEIVREYKDKDGVDKTDVVWTMNKGENFKASSAETIGHETDKNVWDIDRKIIDDVIYTPSENDDKSTGTVHVKFDPEYKIGPNNDFKLCFNVKVSDKAKKELREEGYPVGIVGDDTTDFDPGDVVTSSEKAGFYANKTGKDGKTEAKLIYRQNSDKKLEMRYPKPVVQVVIDYNLPSTGSPLGTWFYTIFGTFLMTSAVLFFKKEKH